MYCRNGKNKGTSSQTEFTSRSDSPLLTGNSDDSGKNPQRKLLLMSERSRFLTCIILAAIVICGILSMLRSTDTEPERDLDNVLAVLFDKEASSSSEVNQNDNQFISDNNFYTVIFDGGSTGSRVHIFHFRKRQHGSLPYLVKEIYNYTRFGLSAYAQNPVEVYQLFMKSPLHVGPFEQSVTILEGAYEGIYLWQAVNFLKGSFSPLSEGSSGVIDLGGGSIQVTYSPQELKSVIDRVDDRDIQEINVFGKSYFLFVHSYLGNGLLVALQGILEIESAMNSVQSTRKDKNQGFYSSVCLPPLFSGKFKFGDKDTTVSGIEPVVSEDVYEQCTDLAKMFLDKKPIQTLPEGTRTGSFIAAGYFISRGTKYKLVDEANAEISVTVGEIKEHTEKACNYLNIYTSNPFECLELAYISSFLSYGFGLHDSAQILIQDKINNVETSWALGAAFHIFQNYNNNR
ncbi:ectonucleoside triphosphate diphosphohydrolase 5-like [Anneissia japonica]|uniref:ectonucleoside triphosphate diphosphohydrolase 5-like n=1 Tax=Anneissia japonica TaxID=1529436 RepID=UPI0014257DBF|nr:ectonucleoside triphosphate diphosphohydrolase 5-like [Anneissia japonica]